MRWKNNILLVGILWLIFFHSYNLMAQRIILNNMVIDNVGGKIQLSFGIYFEEFEKVYNYLKNGIPLKLICRSELLQKRFFWLDKELMNQRLVFEIKNNPLSEDFILKNQSRNETCHNKVLKDLIDKKLDELVINLGDWKSLSKDKEYILRLKVTLKEANFPGWLKRALFFWSWDTLSSRTYLLKFNY